MPIAEELPPHEQYVIDVLLYCAPGSSLPKDRSNPTPTPFGIQPCPPNEKGEPLVVPVLLSTVEKISHLRLHLPKDIRPLSARDVIRKSVLEAHRRFPNGIPLLDPIKNMHITDDRFKALVGVSLTDYWPICLIFQLTMYLQKIDAMEKKLHASPLTKDPRLPNLYTRYKEKQDCQQRIRELKKQIQATHDVLQMEELKARKRVLRRLAFTTQEDIVDMKGRVACEISSGDELLLTELIFNGVFNSLSPEECAGLLSCFVFSEKVSRASSDECSIVISWSDCNVLRRASRKRTSRASWPLLYMFCRTRQDG